MDTQSLQLDVVVQCYRDMTCLGEQNAYQVRPGGVNRLQMKPGGVLMNAASMLVLTLDHVERFIDGWYTGMASLTFDHVKIGEWRPFQFNVYNDDAPSVVHFNPSAILVGVHWPPERPQFDQCIYSFAIRPWRSQLAVSRETED